MNLIWFSLLKHVGVFWIFSGSFSASFTCRIVTLWSGELKKSLPIATFSAS